MEEKIMRLELAVEEIKLEQVSQGADIRGMKESMDRILIVVSEMGQMKERQESTKARLNDHSRKIDDLSAKCSFMEGSANNDRYKNGVIAGIISSAIAIIGMLFK